MQQLHGDTMQAKAYLNKRSVGALANAGGRGRENKSRIKRKRKINEDSVVCVYSSNVYFSM